MAELTKIMEQYAQNGHLSKFLMDYVAERDTALNEKPITRDNLNGVMPTIIAGLELRLSKYKSAA